ncbi:Mevalonate kinase [uncultured archaeon]|nr:Mevalonate kinase [uncultured archaeon]
MIKKVRAPIRIDFAGGTTDIKPFTDIYGGAVLNAAINHYVVGELDATNSTTHLEYTGDIPTSSGLGTSSAMNVVFIALITHLNDKNKISEAVYNLEHSISESRVNGKQDMYAAAFGGINYMEFKGDKVKVHALNLKKELIQELEKRLVLVYSGKSHLSGTSNKAMIDNLIKGKNDKNLLRIKEIAGEMKNSLLKGDLYEFARLMNCETEERAKLSKVTLSPQLKSIIDSGMKNGGIGAKICGSGGGGSILMFAEDRKKLVSHFGKKVIPFKFDFEGLKWK